MKVGPVSGDNRPSRTAQHEFPNLRNGRTLNLYVEARRGRSVMVRIGGRRLSARFEGEVRPGNWYRVEVVKTGRVTLFRSIHQAPAPVDLATLARTYELPGPHAEAVLRAFIRTALPLHPERLQLALRRVNASGRLTVAERARLAAILEDKGLFSEPLWERALEALSGESGGRGDDDSRGEGESPDRGQANLQESGDPEAPDPDAIEHLAHSLREMMTGPQTPDDVLQLVNHREGRNGHWVIIPLEFEQSPEFSASIKMRCDGGGRFGEAILDVRRSDERWTFALHPRSSGFRVVALGTPTPVEGRFWAPLRERLENLGMEFDRVLMSKDSNDGFSSDDDTAIIRRVDSRV